MTPTHAEVAKAYVNNPQGWIQPETRPDSTNKLVFYGVPPSPYSQRVYIYLVDRKIDHEIVHIGHGDQRAKWFIEGVNPLHKVPAIERNGDPMNESQVIVEYLSKLNEGPNEKSPFCARDIRQCAHEQVFLRHLDSVIVPATNEMIETVDEAEIKAYHEKLDIAFEYIENVGLTGDGPFFSGSSLGIVDAVYAPTFLHLIAHAHWRGYTIPVQLKKVHAWSAALLEHPSVVATSVNRDFLVSVYQYTMKKIVIPK
jgi:glutathione S-transferase